MNDDDLDLQELGDRERVAAALAAGELDLQPVDDPAEAARMAAGMPPPGAPVNVIRPVRVPYDMDTDVRRLAQERGLSISAMLRDLITVGLEVTTGVAPDPVTELKRGLDVAQRAAAALTANRHRDAA